MRRVKHRAVSVLVIAAALAAGLGLYLVKFAVSGGAWASSKVNAAVYSSGALALGAVTDRNGVVLAEARDGVRIFAEDKTLRKATLHAVGDVAGNIGTGALKTQIPALVGYNPVFGTYSLSGSGGTVRLSIDSELNLAAYSALDGRHGAVVVIDCATGELLCSVSSPAFDPNNPSEVDPDSPKYDGVYLNRALSSAFTPGSVFKLVTAAAALENIPDIE
ncbi:MAG: penicillin-binding protein, partial [Oscillospiraceae bacterium]|nr:penicillin-binding protein [Oscillospiraceae bacterium]